MEFQESSIPQFDVVYGRELLAETKDFAAEPVLIVTMEDLWPKIKPLCPDKCRVYFVESLERSDLEKDISQCDNMKSILGIGGGQAVDCAKFFAWQTRLPLYQFPTSLSVDAVFGHRTAIRENGVVKYIGWAVPEAVYVDFNIIENAPIHINRAGIGDVLCFFTGLWDWKYAWEKGRCEKKWPYNKSLAQISSEKARNLLDNPEDIRDMTPEGIRLMVDALRWGGASYHGAGWCPRHVEGVEHYFFYSLEALTRKKFLHGQAVCLGIMVGAMMHNQRTNELLNAIHKIGVDIRPEKMGVTWPDVFEAIRGLKKFVTNENLPFGIAHDFIVNDAFLNGLKQLITDKEWGE